MAEPDLLHHWKAIAGHIGVKPDAARHLAKTAALPVFKVGTKTVCASRAALDAWIANLAAARKAPAA